MGQMWVSSLSPIEDEIAIQTVRKEYWRYLQISGVYPEIGGSLKYVVIFQFVFILSILTFDLYLLTNTVLLSLPYLEVLSEALHFFFILAINLNSIVLFNVRRSEMTKVHSIIGMGFYDYKEDFVQDVEVAQLQKQSRNTKKFWTNFLPVFMLVCVLFLLVLTPIFKSLYPPKAIPDIGIVKSLPVACWTPFDSSSGFFYYFMFSLEAIQATVTLCILASADLVYAVVSENICYQLRLLKLSIRRLRKRSFERYRSKKITNQTFLDDTLFNDPEFQESYEYCLNCNIKHHIIIQKCFKLFAKLIDEIVLFVFCSGGILLAAASLVIISGGNNVTTIVLSIMFCILEILNFFFLCWYGEQIFQLSCDIRTEIYLTDWYLCSEKIKRSMRIIMEATRKPLLLTTGGLIPANMVTFANILNASYSYINLIFASSS